MLMAFSGHTAADMLPPPPPQAQQRPVSAGRRAVAAGRAAADATSTAGKPLNGAANVDDDAATKLAKTNTMRARMGLVVAEANPVAAAGAVGGAVPSRRGSGGDVGASSSKPAGPPTAAALFKVLTHTLPMPLQALDVTACHQLTDRSLAFIGANCPDLEFLRLRLCDQLGLSDAAIVAIAQVRIREHGGSSLGAHFFSSLMHCRGAQSSPSWTSGGGTSQEWLRCACDICGEVLALPLLYYFL